MARDRDLGLLLDRRSPTADRPFPNALRPVVEIDLGSDSELSAWLVRSQQGSPLPRTVQSLGFGVQSRLLDRFYLPEIANEAVVRTLFDIVAVVYDSMTDAHVNRATAARLLEAAASAAGVDPLILDFGCGTGVAFDVAGSKSPKCRLVGTDISNSMLRLAQARGQRTVQMNAWRLDPPSVDGAIASFVLHYGVAKADLATLASSLRPDGVFAANMFRMSEEKMSVIDSELDRLGLTLVLREPFEAEQTSNFLASYRKRS